MLYRQCFFLFPLFWFFKFNFVNVETKNFFKIFCFGPFMTLSKDVLNLKFLSTVTLYFYYWMKICYTIDQNEETWLTLSQMDYSLYCYTPVNSFSFENSSLFLKNLKKDYCNLKLNSINSLLIFLPNALSFWNILNL